jgi:hypothetical protein
VFRCFAPSGRRESSQKIFGSLGAVGALQHASALPNALMIERTDSQSMLAGAAMQCS